MTVAETRERVAQALTEALEAQRVTVHAYRPTGSRRARTAWLQLGNVDTVDVTYGEVRVQLEVVLPVANDQADFERAFDRLAGPLVEALQDLGRGITVRPYTEVIDAANLLCVVGTLTTETEL